MVVSTFIPIFSALLIMKLVSNSALCATITAPSQNSRNLGRISSILGAFITIWSLMCVSVSILNGIGISGLTNVENLSTISPLHTLTAPISIILSTSAENPVVSRSNTTYVSLKLCPLGFVTICLVSSTR